MAREKIATAVLELTTEHGRFFKDLDEIEGRSSRIDKSWRDTGKTLQSFGRQTSDVGQAMTKMSLPLLALGVGAAKAAVDVESSFAGVRKTVDATEEEFSALSDGFRDMAKEIPVSVNELNRIGEAAGQLGIKKENILGFTRVMADLGVATNLSSEEAATSLARLANITQMPQDEFGRLGSTIVALGNNFATTEREIVAMGLRLAGAGHQIGLTEGQILAVGTALSSVGIEAEAGGSAMSKVMINMASAVSKGGTELRQFASVAGMSSKDFATAFKTDAAGAVNAFIVGLGNMKASGGDVLGTLEAMGIEEVRMRDALLRASGAGDLLTRALDLQAVAWAENTALTKEATERYKTTESQLKTLWNRINDVAVTLGNALLPAIKTAVGALTSLLPMLEGAAKGFASMPGFVQLAAIGLGGLLIAAGPVVFVVGQLITSVGVVTTALWTFGNTVPVIAARLKLMEFAASQAGLIMRGFASGIAVVGVAIASWQVGRWIGETTGLTDVVGRLSSKFGEMIGLLPKGSNEQYKAAMAARKAAEEAKGQAAALDAATDSTQALLDVNTFIGPVLDRNANGMDDFGEAADEAKKKAEEFAKSLRALGGADAIDGAKEVVKQLNALGGPLKVLPSKLADMAARLMDGAEAARMMGKAKLAEGYELLAKTLSPVVQFQQRYNVTIGEYVTDADAASSATAALWEQFHRLTGQVQKIGPTLLKTSLDLSKMFEPLKKGFDDNMKPSFWKKAWAPMTDGLKKTLGDIPETLADAFTGGGDVMGAIKSIVSQVGSKIGGALGFAIGGPLGQKLGAAVGSMAGLIVEPFKKIFGIGINEAVKKANGEINTLRNQLLDTHGPLDQLEAKANAVGLSFEANWGHQGQAGLKAFQDLVTEFTRRWDALNQELADTRSQLSGAIGEARELGYEFNESGELIGVNFDTMRAKAQEFGVDINSLGPALRQQAITAEAQRIIDGFTLMSKAAGPEGTGGILVGLKDEIGAVVGRSIELGTTVPANMEPWIKELIRTDQLVDENGNAITDLSAIKFGEPVATEFEKISTKISELVTAIGVLVEKISTTLTPALDNATRDRTINVSAQYHDPGPPPGFGEWGGVPAIPMAEGGMGRVTQPTLFLAGEAGAEDFAFSGGGRRFDKGQTPAGDVTGLRSDLKNLRNAIEGQTNEIIGGFRDAVRQLANA